MRFESESMLWKLSLSLVNMEGGIIHWALHLPQMAIILVALYYLLKNYRSVRSKFNLGLIVFGIAMLLQIAFFLVFFTLSEDVIFHLAGEIAEIVALIIFLYLITR